MTIHKRLIYGYSLIFGISLMGTMAGLAAGNYYQSKALEFRQEVTSERKFLNDLQIQILYNRPAQQLSPHLNNIVEFRIESQKLLGRLSSLQLVLANHPDGHDNFHDSPATQTTKDALHQRLEAYETTIKQFHQRTQAFIQSAEQLYETADQPTNTNIKALQQLLLALEQSPEFIAFIKFPDQLAPFQSEVDIREKTAETALKRAESLRNEIILGSLGTSLAIAALIAWWTSRAIVRPIQAVTHVAQQVTLDSNFDLEVPVHHQDEVGILANALNQLIKQVKLLLSQLRQKNQDLEQALTQLGKQQQQLVQAEKMSSLGQLVAGVAHEINNPVNFIHGNLVHVDEHTQDLLTAIRLYQTHYSDHNAELAVALEDVDLAFIQEDLPKILQSMQLGTTRIRDIVLSLRKFSHMDEAEVKAVDIHDGLNNTLILLQHRLKPTSVRSEIVVEKCYGNLPEVECYPGLLNQVFMNILANGIDALEDKVELHPSEAIDAPLRQITIQTALMPAQSDEPWVEVAIADNAMGIPDTIQKRIFDPFFTTKPMGKGTGMGMSISYQIVTERHRGRLLCKSTIGQGTTFLIQLPIQQIGTETELSQLSLNSKLTHPSQAIA